MSLNNEIIPDFDSESDESLKISLKVITEAPRTILIDLNGTIHTYNCNFFNSQISKILQAGYINLIFSCENLTYIASTGIGSFTSFLKILRTRGGKIVFLKIQQKVYEVFQLLGFSQFFNIEEELSEAIKIILKQKEEPEIFPKIISCPICTKQLTAKKPGKFRCPTCKSVISISDRGFTELV